MDIILGKPRRGWSNEEKLAIIAEAFAPGSRVKEVLRRHAISSGLLYTWRKQLRAKSETAASVCLSATPAVPPPPSSEPMRFLPLAIATETATTIDITVGRATMKITGAIDAALMAALVKALAGKSR